MIEHLSYSSISSYLNCGAWWNFKYVQKIAIPASPALAFGSAIHTAIEEHIQGNGALLDMWGPAWEKAIDQPVEWGMETPEQHYNEGIRILTDPEIQRGVGAIKPREIERKVELHVPGVPVPVIGYIDVITEDGVPGDFKTSAKSWSSEKAMGEMQPLFYLAALSQAGEKVDGWRFRHYTIIKTKQPKFEVFEISHSPKELFFLFNVINQVWQAIQAGIYPYNPTGWKCSSTYCEFWMQCRGKYV